MDETDLRRKLDRLLAVAAPSAGAPEAIRRAALDKARQLALAHGLPDPTYVSSCAGVPRPRAASVLRCAYCHEESQVALHVCLGCGTFLHVECRDEIGCPTLGCTRRRARPAPPPPAAPPPPVRARPVPAPEPAAETRGAPNGLNGRGRSIWNR